jgi:hypothetical protein
MIRLAYPCPVLQNYRIAASPFLRRRPHPHLLALIALCPEKCPDSHVPLRTKSNDAAGVDVLSIISQNRISSKIALPHVQLDDRSDRHEVTARHDDRTHLYD